MEYQILEKHIDKVLGAPTLWSATTPIFVKKSKCIHNFTGTYR